MLILTDPPVIDPAADEVRYLPVGGLDHPTEYPDFAVPAAVGSLDFSAEAFLTLEDALNAWVRRRNSPLRTWATWAAGMILTGDLAEPVVELVDGDDVIVASWTLQQALDILDRADELPLYAESF